MIGRGGIEGISSLRRIGKARPESTGDGRGDPDPHCKDERPEPPLPTVKESLTVQKEEA